MLGSFISKHGIKVAVLLLIAGAVYNFKTTSVIIPKGYKGYSVDNNYIFYNGEVQESLLQQMGVLLQKFGLFDKATKNVFIMDQITKKSESGLVFSVPIDPMLLSEGMKKDLANICLNLKINFFINKQIVGCLVKPQDLTPIQCLAENELIALIGVQEQNKQQDQNETKNEDPNEKNENKDDQSSASQILDRWTIGATKISNAQHFSPINQNDIWRLYYTEDYSEAATSVGASIYENNLLSTQYFKYFALFVAKDNNFNNGLSVYHFAIPFNKDDLNNGQAEQEAAKYYKVLKAGYMRDYRLVIALCDYDFNIVKVYSE